MFQKNMTLNNNDNDDNTKKSTITYDIEYYTLFATYRGRRVFTNEDIKRSFKEMVSIFLHEMGCEIIEINVFVDHVYLSIKACPNVCPATLLNSLRHNTSIELKKYDQKLSKAKAIWQRNAVIFTRPIKKKESEEFLESVKSKKET